MNHQRPPQRSAPADEPTHDALAARLVLIIAPLIVVVATLAAFWGALDNDFVRWDDDANLLFNEAYKGLSPGHLWWMLTTSFAGHYHPLTWFSHAVDYTIWVGEEPFGYHFTNLLLHAATAVGFLYVAAALIRAAIPQSGERYVLLGAIAAALLFALHPLRVESVAWATERRDVLSGVWLMATTLLYLKAVSSEATSRYRWLIGLSLACYVLALSSKAIGMTWPVVLLLLDVYPLKRIRRPFVSQDPAVIKRVLVEKALFLVPAIVFAALAVWAQRDAGALRTMAEHPPSLRVAQALYGIMFYLGKTVWPITLLPLYEQRPDAWWGEGVYMLSAALVLGLAMLAINFHRRFPAFLAALACYIVLLSPVLGFAQSGPQVVADRYSYLPSMVWAVLIGGGLTKLWLRARPGGGLARAGATLAVPAVVVVCFMMTRAQVEVWSDSRSLWEHTIARAPNTPLAHANLAGICNQQGLHVEAAEHARKTLEILPGNRVAHLELAYAASELGDVPLAEDHFLIALRIRPFDPDATLGLAMLYAGSERLVEARLLYDDLAERNPDDPDVKFLSASLSASQGRTEEALKLFDDVLRLDPQRIAAYHRAAVLLVDLGDYAGAMDRLAEGLRRSPRENAMTTRLAWILATCPDSALRDGKLALDLAQMAVEDSSGQNLLAIEALAAALARTDAFEQAVEKVQSLLSEHPDALTDEARQRIEKELQAYSNNRAFEDS